MCTRCKNIEIVRSDVVIRERVFGPVVFVSFNGYLSLCLSKKRCL